MTAYQVICAIREGKIIYWGERGDKVRFIWALSLENAKSKFPGWVISEYATLVVSMVVE